MRALTVVAILAVAGAIAVGMLNCRKTVQVTEAEEAAFARWATEFGKIYNTPSERAYRRSVFLKTLLSVQNLNKVNTYRSGLNQFSDMTFEEFLAKYTGLNKPNSDEKNYADLSGIEILPAVDWRNQPNVVNPIKNQGQCGSCWAFSATSAIESAYSLKTTTLYDLSEQQMVDCSSLFGNQGCNGGWMNRAFLYIKTMGGQMKNSDYPYVAQDEKCKFKKADAVVKISGYTDIPAQNCEAIRTAVNTQPISVAIEVTNSFMKYQSGVYTTTECGTQVNHAVNVVGYNSQPSSGSPYWIVRNSWGTSWGSQGYILMDMSDTDPKSHGLCAICDYGTYPTI